MLSAYSSEQNTLEGCFYLVNRKQLTGSYYLQKMFNSWKVCFSWFYKYLITKICNGNTFKMKGASPICNSQSDLIGPALCIFQRNWYSGQRGLTPLTPSEIFLMPQYNPSKIAIFELVKKAAPHSWHCSKIYIIEQG